MTEVEYRNHPALNVSRLCLMAKSPLHFHLNDFEETPAMRLGTNIHLAILEPEKFKRLYVVEPDEINGEPRNNRLKAHKEYMDKWRADQDPQSIILSPDDMESIAGIILSISNEIKANRGPLPLAEIFANGEFEVPLIREMHGRLCKGRADVVVKSKNFGKVIVDLKKVGRKGQAGADEFRRVVSNLHYDAKAAWYKDLFEADNFAWLAVEEKKPYPLGFYNAEPFLEIGAKKYKQWLTRLAECEAKNDWPSYTNGLDALYPSAWAISQHNEETW